MKKVISVDHAVFGTAGRITVSEQVLHVSDAVYVTLMGGVGEFHIKGQAPDLPNKKAVDSSSGFMANYKIQTSAQNVRTPGVYFTSKFDASSDPQAPPVLMKPNAGVYSWTSIVVGRNESGNPQFYLVVVPAYGAVKKDTVENARQHPDQLMIGGKINDAAVLAATEFQAAGAVTEFDNAGIHPELTYKGIQLPAMEAVIPWRFVGQEASQASSDSSSSEATPAPIKVPIECHPSWFELTDALFLTEKLQTKERQTEEGKQTDHPGYSRGGRGFWHGPYPDLHTKYEARVAQEQTKAADALPDIQASSSYTQLNPASIAPNKLAQMLQSQYPYRTVAVMSIQVGDDALGTSAATTLRNVPVIIDTYRVEGQPQLLVQFPCGEPEIPAGDQARVTIHHLSNEGTSKEGSLLAVDLSRSKFVQEGTLTQRKSEGLPPHYIVAVDTVSGDPDDDIYHPNEAQRFSYFRCAGEGTPEDEFFALYKQTFRPYIDVLKERGADEQTINVCLSALRLCNAEVTRFLAELFQKNLSGEAPDSGAAGGASYGEASGNELESRGTAADAGASGSKAQAEKGNDLATSETSGASAAQDDISIDPAMVFQSMVEKLENAASLNRRPTGKHQVNGVNVSHQSFAIHLVFLETLGFVFGDQLKATVNM